MKINKVKFLLYKNKLVKRDVKNGYMVAEKNKVNLNAWINPQKIIRKEVQNIGDWLSPIIVKNVAAQYGIDINKEVSQTKHLYAIGSILLGWQDATIWGSGFLSDPTTSKFFNQYAFMHRHFHKTDIRVVRGPETRRILLEMGLSCPEIYGDPALLLPYFYTPKKLPKKEYVLVPHFNEWEKYSKHENVVATFNNNWELFVDKICSSELIISSSLHGIILAEAYGKPAVFLENRAATDYLKYQDYYAATGRTNFPIVSSINEGLSIHVDKPANDQIKKLQENLLSSFPIDLYE